MIGINAKPQPGSQAPAPQGPPRPVRVIKTVSPGATGHNENLGKKVGRPELIVVEYWMFKVRKKWPVFVGISFLVNLTHMWVRDFQLRLCWVLVLGILNMSHQVFLDTLLLLSSTTSAPVAHGLCHLRSGLRPRRWSPRRPRWTALGGRLGRSSKTWGKKPLYLLKLSP